MYKTKKEDEAKAPSSFDLKEYYFI